MENGMNGDKAKHITTRAAQWGGWMLLVAAIALWLTFRRDVQAEIGSAKQDGATQAHIESRVRSIEGWQIGHESLVRDRITQMDSNATRISVLESRFDTFERQQRDIYALVQMLAINNGIKLPSRGRSGGGHGGPTPPE
jgi:hypothetical protein